MPRFNLKYGALFLIVQALLQPLVWGFSVDDAWIVTRVAYHGLQSGQFHFNLGSATDAITPFGFAHLVAGLGRAAGGTQKMELFQLARVGGLCAQLLSFFLAGGLISRSALISKTALSSKMTRGAEAVLLLFGCLSSAIWAGAGLSTPWVGLVLVLGLWCLEMGEDVFPTACGGFCFGWAAAWRPELAPFCAVLLFIRRFPHLRAVRDNRSVAFAACFAFAGPLTLVALSRWWSFGSIVPLSAVAKAPSFEHGLWYGVVSLVWGGLILFSLCAPGMFRRGGPGPPVLVHLVAVVLCGGDWMPGLRLWAPIYPVLLVLSVSALGPPVGSSGTPGAEPFSGSVARRLWALGALIGVPVMPLLLVLQQGDDLRAVIERRIKLVTECKGALEEARVIAAVDVGWVGMASDARLVDLGGITDPSIGRLAGGHTDRPLSAGLFSDRDVDTWIIHAWDRSYVLGEDVTRVDPVYHTDHRLLRSGAAAGMSAIHLQPLEGTSGQYVILRTGH